MMKTWRAAAALLLAVLLLAACGRTEETPPTPPATQPPAATSSPVTPTPAAAPTQPPEPQTPELWLAEDCPLCAGMMSLFEDYRAQQPDTALTLRRFENTDALLAALDGEKPALLLLSESAAAQLGAEGLLGTLTQRPALPTLFSQSETLTGPGFVPLGARAPVLVLQEETRASLADCESLEALCAWAVNAARRGGGAGFSADSFAQLFACALAQKDCPFAAELTQDRENEAFREVYNLLAEAAFEGALLSLDEPVVDRVARGEMSFGICSSLELARADRAGLAVLPLPPMEGCQALVEAELWGLAVLPGAEREAETLIAWLFAEGRAAEEATLAGLIPATACPDADAAADGLWLAAQRCLPFMPAADSGYRRQGALFEQRFRAALALLQ